MHGSDTGAAGLEVVRCELEDMASFFFPPPPQMALTLSGECWRKRPPTTGTMSGSPSSCSCRRLARTD